MSVIGSDMGGLGGGGGAALGVVVTSIVVSVRQVFLSSVAGGAAAVQVLWGLLGGSDAGQTAFDGDTDRCGLMNWCGWFLYGLSGLACLEAPAVTSLVGLADRFPTSLLTCGLTNCSGWGLCGLVGLASAAVRVGLERMVLLPGETDVAC